MRAPKYCTHYDTSGVQCLNLVPAGTRNCPEHQSRWDRSTRRRTGNWRTTRARILDRDNHTCYLCGGPANEVDHIDNLGGEQDSNLASICRNCHTRKTVREALESRLTRRQG